MDEINFSALAPRYGAHPLMGQWNSIGTSQMSGGAINWGNVWSSVKNFGSRVKNYGSRIWNSNASKTIRQKIKDSGISDKLGEVAAQGIHGAVDIAQLHMNQAIQNKIDSMAPPPEEVEVEELVEPPVGAAIDPPSKVDPVPMITDPAPPPYEEVVKTKKRPRDELVIETAAPPAYETIFPNKSGNPIMTLEEPIIKTKEIPRTYPMVKPEAPLKVEVVAPPPEPAPTPVVAAPTPSSGRRRRQGWQGALNNIVGMGASIYHLNKMRPPPIVSLPPFAGNGVHYNKRRRCY